MLSLAILLAIPLVSARGLFESHLQPIARDATVSSSTTATVPQIGANAYFCERLALSVPLDINTCLTTSTTLAGKTTTTETCTVTTVTLNLDTQCVCVAAGVLTPSTSASLAGQVVLSNPLVSALIPPTTATSTSTADLAKALRNLDASVTTRLDNDADGHCNYPFGAYPNSCSSCTFDCPNNGVPCGTFANPTCADSCPSGITKRSFSVRSNEYDFRCARGMAVCGIPEGTRSDPSLDTPFECIDTKTDIESCGGCVVGYMLREASGEDCTAIPNSVGVKCRSGRCQVSACEAGYRVRADGRGCEVKILGEGSRYGQKTWQKRDKPNRRSAKKGTFKSR